jgi:hypothetical protein
MTLPRILRVSYDIDKRHYCMSRRYEEEIKKGECTSLRRYFTTGSQGLAGALLGFGLPAWHGLIVGPRDI